MFTLFFMIVWAGTFFLLYPLAKFKEFDLPPDKLIWINRREECSRLLLTIYPGGHGSPTDAIGINQQQSDSILNSVNIFMFNFWLSNNACTLLSTYIYFFLQLVPVAYASRLVLLFLLRTFLFLPVLRIRIKSFWVTRTRIRSFWGHPDPDPVFLGHPDPDPNFWNRIRGSGS